MIHRNTKWTTEETRPQNFSLNAYPQFSVSCICYNYVVCEITSRGWGIAAKKGNAGYAWTKYNAQSRISRKKWYGQNGTRTK